MATVITDDGVQLKFGEDPPKLFEFHVQAAVRRQVERLVARKHGLDAGLRADLRVPIALLKSKAADGVPAGDRALLKCIIGNAIWTAQRCNIAGYDVSPVCSMCGAAADTLFHRAWECTHRQVVAARRDICDQQFIDKALQAGSGSLLYTRCIPTVDVAEVVAPAAQQLRYVRDGNRIEDPAQWSFQGQVFYDGSCVRSASRSIASFAIVQVDGDCTVRAALQGTVLSHLPQTSQAAEHSGRCAAVQLLRGATTLFGDCANVVDSGNKRDRVAMNGKTLYAGLRKASVLSGTSHLVLADIKVKAHREDAHASSANELFCIRANRFADEYAKDALNLHQIDVADIAADKQRLNQAKTIAKVLVATCKLWPKATKSERQRMNHEAKPSRRETHAWIQRKHADVWQCQACLTTAKCGASFARRRFSACQGAALGITGIISDLQGHSLFTTTDSADELIVVCMRCGCYATRSPDNLRRPCTGKKTSAGRAALSRLENGRHPATNGCTSVHCLVPITWEMRRSAKVALEGLLRSRSLAVSSMY